MEDAVSNIFTEYQDQLVKIAIQSRLDSGPGALFINLGDLNELDISYYLKNDLPSDLVIKMDENNNIKNTIYFVFNYNNESRVIEHHLK